MSTAAAAPSPAAEPSWFWDNDRQSGNCAIRNKAGETLLVVAEQAEFYWGIYQPRPGNWGMLPDGTLRRDVDLELIQIRGNRDDARSCAIEMAVRTGMIK